MKVHQTFRIDPELLKRVKKQAKKENRKIGNLYETAVLGYITMIETSEHITKKYKG